jgi:hypothetical protein
MGHHVLGRLASFLTTVVLAISSLAGTVKNTEPQQCGVGGDGGVSIDDFIVWDGSGENDEPVWSVAPCPFPRTIKFETFDITARAGLDYVPVHQGIFTFPAGTTSATFKIQILGEPQREPDETFGIRLTSGATFVDPIAEVTIKER